MSLSHESVGSKIPAKINTFMLTWAELLIHLCYEIPCIWTFVCRQAFLSFYEEIGIKKLMMLMILQAVDSFWFCVFHLIMMQITAEIQSTFYIMKITVQAFIMIPSLCSLYNTNTNAKKHSVTRNCSDLSLFE